MWEGLPSCLPATPQIVYMVPRSGDSECTPLRSALSILFTLNFASKFTVGQLGNLGDDFNGPGTIATTTTRVSYGLEIGDEVHIDPTGSPIQLAGCPGSPMASIVNNTAMVISTGFVSIGNTTPDRHFEVILTAESPPNALLIALRSSRPVCLVPGSWNGSNRAGENHCGTVCHNCLPALIEPCPERNETSTARQLTLVLLPQGSKRGILLVLRVPRQGHFAWVSNLHFHTGDMVRASYQIGHQSLVITIGHESSLITAIMGEPACGHVLHVEGSVDQTPGTIWAYTIYTNLLAGIWQPRICQKRTGLADPQSPWPWLSVAVTKFPSDSAAVEKCSDKGNQSDTAAVALACHLASDSGRSQLGHGLRPGGSSCKDTLSGEAASSADQGPLCCKR